MLRSLIRVARRRAAPVAAGGGRPRLRRLPARHRRAAPPAGALAGPRRGRPHPPARRPAERRPALPADAGALAAARLPRAARAAGAGRHPPRDAGGRRGGRRAAARRDRPARAGVRAAGGRRPGERAAGAGHGQAARRRPCAAPVAISRTFTPEHLGAPVEPGPAAPTAARPAAPAPAVVRGRRRRAAPGDARRPAGRRSRARVRHRVVRGDNLADLALRYYGDARGLAGDLGGQSGPDAGARARLRRPEPDLPRRDARHPGAARRARRSRSSSTSSGRATR